MITPLAERYVRAKVKGCHLSIVLLMAISCNLDNLGIGIAYGTRRVSIPFTSNLLIAVITTIGTFLSVILGQTMYILSIITIWVGIKVGHYYGHRFFGRLTEPAAGVLLVIIGIYEILS